MKQHFLLILPIIFAVYLVYKTLSKDSKQKQEEILNAEDYLGKQVCKSDTRSVYNNCECPIGFYDDQIHNECQKCPYPCLRCNNDTVNFCQSCSEEAYLSFDHLIPEQKILELDDYLVNEVQIYNLNQEDIINFKARGKYHADSFFLSNKINWKPTYKFYDDRVYRLNEYFWQKNDNYSKRARKLSEFVENLDLFEYTGAFAIIINHPYSSGVRHKDHQFKSHQSEFIWMRFNDLKQFYIQDSEKNKYYVKSNTAFFDDKRIHNIGTIDQYSYSIRIDGKFKPWARQYILDNFAFDSDDYRELFIQQEDKIQPFPYNDKEFLASNSTLVEEIQQIYKATSQ